MFAGARWVATRACKARAAAGRDWFGDPARGSFLTTVWLLDGTQAEWDDVGRDGDGGAAAPSPSRMFPGRDHVHTAVYRYFGEASADDTLSAAVALDHGYAGRGRDRDADRRREAS